MQLILEELVGFAHHGGPHLRIWLRGRSFFYALSETLKQFRCLFEVAAAQRRT